MIPSSSAQGVWGRSWEGARGESAVQGTASRGDEGVVLAIPCGELLGSPGVVINGENEPSAAERSYGFSGICRMSALRGPFGIISLPKRALPSRATRVSLRSFVTMRSAERLGQPSSSASSGTVSFGSMVRPESARCSRPPCLPFRSWTRGSPSALPGMPPATRSACRRRGSV